MATVEVVQEEREARAKLRQLERMRRGRNQQLARERRERERRERAIRAWIRAEHAAHDAWLASAENEAERDPKLKRKWLDLWAHSPVFA